MDIDRLILTVIWKVKRPRTGNSMLKEGKVTRLTLHDLQTHVDVDGARELCRVSFVGGLHPQDLIASNRPCPLKPLCWGSGLQHVNLRHTMLRPFCRVS